MPPCARRQSGEAHGSDTDAHQLGHRMTERGHHAAYLTVAALVNGQLHFPLPRAAFALLAAHQAHILGGPGQAVVQHDAATQAPERVFIGDSRHRNAVGFRDMVTGMSHLKQEVAVVGQEDQAFTVGIQAPNRTQKRVAADVH